MRRILFIQILLLSGILLTISSCNTSNQDKTILSVSILPQELWLDLLTNNEANTNCLISPGNNPTTYNPTPQQMTLLSKSSHYFYVDGLSFEDSWLEKFKELNPNMQLVNCSQGIIRIKSDHDHGDHGHSEMEHHSETDPHIWVSPKRAKKMITNMYNVLKQDAIPNDTILKENYLQLMKRMDKLDSLFIQANSANNHKTFIIYHPALAYLAADYGYTQMAIEKDGKEPSAAHIKHIIETINTQHIPYIFIQKQFDKKSAQLIAKETNAELIEIDPLGYDYFKEFEFLAKKFSEL